MMEILLIRIVKGKIQDTHYINSLQLIIPFPSFSLFTNRKGGVKDATILEELLFTTLLCIKISYILDYFLLE